MSLPQEIYLYSIGIHLSSIGNWSLCTLRYSWLDSTLQLVHTLHPATLIYLGNIMRSYVTSGSSKVSSWNLLNNLPQNSLGNPLILSQAQWMTENTNSSFAPAKLLVNRSPKINRDFHQSLSQWLVCSGVHLKTSWPVSCHLYPSGSPLCSI